MVSWSMLTYEYTLTFIHLFIIKNLTFHRRSKMLLTAQNTQLVFLWCTMLRCWKCHRNCRAAVASDLPQIYRIMKNNITKYHFGKHWNAYDRNLNVTVNLGFLWPFLQWQSRDIYLKTETDGLRRRKDWGSCICIEARQDRGRAEMSMPNAYTETMFIIREQFSATCRSWSHAGEL